MLVKLGDIWVDPAKVVLMEPNMEKICIVTPDGSTTTSGDINTFASIINNSGQSFGGENETPKEI